MADAKPNLNLHHPDYDATEAARTAGRDLYEGDAAVKAKGETYLYKETNESQTDYNLRLKRAVLDPYVAKVIDARQAILFRKEAVRDLPEALAAFAGDVDRKGTPAQTFFEDAARDAQVDGVHWVLVDMPRRPTDAAGAPVDLPSREAEAQAGMRPFFQHVPGASVLDWDDDDFNWAVVAETVAAAGREPGGERTTVERRKVWTRAEWILYESTDGGEFVEVDRGDHPLGEVPLVPWLGDRYSDRAGYPVARAVFPHVLSIYNKTSDLDWFERLSAHPIPWQIGPEPLAVLDAGKGVFLRSAPGTEVAIGYLEPAGTGFASLRESIRELQAKIYAIALAQAQKDSAQVQAAEGQREDRRMFTSGLRAVSFEYEANERRCWELAARWQAPTAAPAEISVTYNRDFDDAAIEAAMIATLTDLMDRALITGRTVLQTLVNGEILELPDGVDAELAQAAREAEERNARAAARTLEMMRGGGTGGAGPGGAGPGDDDGDDGAPAEAA